MVRQPFLRQSQNSCHLFSIHFFTQMPQSNIPLYLILYLSMVPVFAVEHGRCRRIKCEEEESPIHREMLTDNHIPGKKWSIIPHPQVIINPYKKLITGELLKPKNVSALSQRCATCLAIADKVRGNGKTSVII